MKGTLEQKKQIATKDFQKFAIPRIKSEWGYDVELLENVENETARGLDFYHTDAYLIKDKKKHTASIRVLYNNKFDTITLRNMKEGGNPAEFERLFDAVINGGFYPEIIIQSYITSNRTQCVKNYLCNTLALIQYIDRYMRVHREIGTDRREPVYLEENRENRYRRMFTVIKIKPFEESLKQVFTDIVPPIELQNSDKESLFNF